MSSSEDEDGGSVDSVNDWRHLEPGSDVDEDEFEEFVQKKREEYQEAREERHQQREEERQERYERRQIEERKAGVKVEVKRRVEAEIENGGSSDDNDSVNNWRYLEPESDVDEDDFEEFVQKKREEYQETRQERHQQRKEERQERYERRLIEERKAGVKAEVKRRVEAEIENGGSSDDNDSVNNWRYLEPESDVNEDDFEEFVQEKREEYQETREERLQQREEERQQREEERQERYERQQIEERKAVVKAEVKRRVEASGPSEGGGAGKRARVEPNCAGSPDRPGTPRQHDTGTCTLM